MNPTDKASKQLGSSIRWENFLLTPVELFVALPRLAYNWESPFQKSNK